MNIKSKWSIITGTVLVSGALLTTGVVFAASGSTAAPATAQPSAQSQADHLDAAVKSGKITQAEADVLKQLGDLRKSAMDKLKADSQSVIDQAVKDGKLTQAEADKLASHDGHMASHDGHMGGHGGFGHRGGHGWTKDGKHGSKSSGAATQDQSQPQTNGQ